MSETGSERRSNVAVGGRTEQPAVGLVVDGKDADGVAGTILRARRHGHDVLVAFETEPSEETLQFAHELEATIVDFTRSAGEAGPDERLTRTARNAGFPGLILHDRAGRTIDYARSHEALEGATSYAVEAEVQSIVGAESGVLVAIPAYNESCTIADVVAEARRHADEVLVVDDGSTDDTAERARQAGAHAVVHDHNKGYGAALKSAFREAKRSGADHLVVIDGDGQHDPADVPRLVERQRESSAEVVIGCRFGEGTGTKPPLYRRFGLTVVNTLTNLSFGVVRRDSWVRDAQSGFRAYGRTAIESLADDEGIGDHMGASTDILHHAHRHNYVMEEVGVTIDYDVENGSSQNPVEHGITLISNLLRTIEQERPLTILGVPGFVSALIGIGLGYWTFSNFIATGNFPLGLAVSSTFFALIGVFTVFTAILLHALKQHLGGLQDSNGS